MFRCSSYVQDLNKQVLVGRKPHVEVVPAWCSASDESVSQECDEEADSENCQV